MLAWKIIGRRLLQVQGLAEQGVEAELAVLGWDRSGEPGAAGKGHLERCSGARGQRAWDAMGLGLWLSGKREH